MCDQLERGQEHLGSRPAFHDIKRVDLDHNHRLFLFPQPAAVIIPSSLISTW